MPNAIERDVYVLRNTLKNPIAYVRGTDLLPIIFHFRDFTIPSGATATAFTAKPDGNAVYGSAAISGNDVTIDVTQQMFIVLGMSMLQVEIKEGEETLTTFIQPVMVEPNLKAGDFPPSTTDINFLDEVIEQSQEAVNNANQAIASANTAIEGANTAASSANQAAENANNAAEDLQDKVDAGDFTASVQVGTTTTLDPDQDATVSNGGTNKDAVLNFGIPKGDPGTAATIQVGTTQTVQPEENAEVTNTGTANAAVLNFKIPRGEDGMTDLTAEYKDDSSYTCQPTVNAPVVVKGVDGKTEQVETTGAQLFDASKIKNHSSGGATVTNNDDGSFTICGSGNLESVFSDKHEITHEETLKLIKDGHLFLKNPKTVPNFIVFVIKKDGGTLYSLVSAEQAQVDVNVNDIVLNEAYLRFIFYSDTGETITPATIKPMLYQDGDGTWEPYTGGSPAPSPDYPQVIKGVGGMGYFDGVWVQGNISSTGTVGTETTGITSANAIPCKQNDNIAVTYEDSIDVIAVAFYNASGAYISTSTSGNSVDTFTATAPANAASFKVNLRVVSGSTITPNGAKYCTVTINGKYQTGVEVHGAQLFDASKLPTKTQGGATVTNNDDGSFTISGNGNLSENFYIGYKYSHEESLKLIKQGILSASFGNNTIPYIAFEINYVDGAVYVNNNGKSNDSKEVTDEIINNPNLSIVIYFSGVKGTTIIPGTIKPMIYQDGDGTYQPYHHTAISIPLASPLYSGDKICYVKPGESYVDADGDTVIADRILYGCYRENAVVVFDGSKDEAWKHFNDTCNQFYTLVSDILYSANVHKAMCDYFKPGVISERETKDNIIYTISNPLGIAINTYSQSSLVNWETWLQSNPLTVVYKLATPYFEPFSDQSIFYGLRTDDTLSYVYSTDPIEPNVTVEVAKNGTGGYLLESYAQAQKNAISEANSQSRLSAIEQQLVNQATTPTE